MKKIGQTFLGIIALMGVVLVFSQCGGKEANAPVVVAEGASTELLPVAYVDADSLVAHLNFHKRLADDFEAKLGKQNASLNAAGQKLQNEIIAFQQKVQNNAFHYSHQKQFQAFRYQWKVLQVFLY
jgi:outer membrane protein